jgi:hypothetical protein
VKPHLSKTGPEGWWVLAESRYLGAMKVVAGRTLKEALEFTLTFQAGFHDGLRAKYGWQLPNV